jgi:hypothetical protein
MQDKLEILNTIKRVSPPDYLYDKILERINNNKIQPPLVYTYAACILLLIAFNIFSFSFSVDANSASINIVDSPLNYLSYQ